MFGTAPSPNRQASQHAALYVRQYRELLPHTIAAAKHRRLLPAGQAEVNVQRVRLWAFVLIHLAQTRCSREGCCFVGVVTDSTAALCRQVGEPFGPTAFSRPCTRQAITSSRRAEDPRHDTECRRMRRRPRSAARTGSSSWRMRWMMPKDGRTSRCTTLRGTCAAHTLRSPANLDSECEVTQP